VSSENQEERSNDPKPRRRRPSQPRSKINAEALAQAREALEEKCRAQAAKHIYNVLPCKIGPLTLLKLWKRGEPALEAANNYDVWLASKLAEDCGSVSDAIEFLEEQQSASDAVRNALTGNE